MTNFKELLIWKKAFNIGLVVLRATKAFPKAEQYGLVSQLNRSAISIASNIAEGAGRGTNKDFNHFLNIAIGSSYELETQLMFATELGYLSQSDFETMFDSIDHLQKMLRKFKSTLQPATLN